MENQSLFCTRKTSFYMDNITSTLTIVVFSINWLRMFALYVRQMCCKLKLKTLNNRKTTASLRNHRKCCVCSDPCICTTQRYSFFFSEVLHDIWRIFPRSFDIVVISDVPTRYLIFCTKQTGKQSLFYRQHPERHVTFPEYIHFPRRMACLCLETSDVEHALCAFSGVCWDYFQVFRRFGCAKWKYCEKWHLPAPKIWNLFFILSRVQREEFHYDKAISCKSYVQLLIQDVCSVSSTTYQL